MPPDGATPDDYEAILSPLYAWMHALTQRSEHRRAERRSGRVRARLGDAQRRRAPPGRLRALALGAGYARGDRASSTGSGSARVERDLSGAALRRGGLHGLREVLRRLDITAPHVIWGHSHRSGPWPGDDLAEWATPAGTRILNAGSWVYEPHYLGDDADRPRPTGRAPPSWSRTAAPPRLIRLLRRSTGAGATPA